MGHSEAGFQGFYPLPRLYNSSTRFLESVRPLFPNSGSCFACPCHLSMECFDADSLTVSTMGELVALVLQIISLCEFFLIFVLYFFTEIVVIIIFCKN